MSQGKREVKHDLCPFLGRFAKNALLSSVLRDRAAMEHSNACKKRVMFSSQKSTAKSTIANITAWRAGHVNASVEEATGTLTRSPMAFALLGSVIEQRGIEHSFADSAGR